MLSVTQPNIQFNGELRDRPQTKRIVIHHSDSDPNTSPEQIHSWHLSKGWAGIGYHYVIKGDGSVWYGRPEGKQGAHAFDSSSREANTDGIGICLCGRFMESPPTDAQLTSLVELIKDINKRNGALLVVRHKDVCATACPGELFPWEKLQQMLIVPVDNIVAEAMSLGMITSPDHMPNDVATKEFVLQVGKNIIKKMEGK